MATITIPDEEVKKLREYLKELNEAGDEWRNLRDKQDTQQRDYDYADGRLTSLVTAFQLVYGDRYKLVEAEYEDDLMGQFHILIRADKLFEDQEERT